MADQKSKNFSFSKNFLYRGFFGGLLRISRSFSDFSVFKSWLCSTINFQKIYNKNVIDIERFMLSGAPCIRAKQKWRRKESITATDGWQAKSTCN